MTLLAGVRALDLGIWRPVPYATQLLVEMGAEVIKVEPPNGDPMRVFPDLFAVLNAGKRSAAIDLKDATERQAVLDLAKEADVVLEGFRPGVAARLGVGYDDVHAINPRAVYCSISGYGQTGPMRDIPGHDLNYQALAGINEPRGDGEPIVGRPPIADLAAGVFAAMSVCAALVRAGRTGEGEYIDVAMADLLTTWTGPLPTIRVEGGPKMGSGGMAGYGTFRTADGGWIALGVIDEQHLWQALTATLGLDDLVPLTFPERVPRVAELNKTIADAVAQLHRAEAVSRLVAAGVPVSPVLAQPELADDPQLLARGVVARAADGSTLMRHPVIYREHPASVLTDVPPLVTGASALPSWSPR